MAWKFLNIGKANAEIARLETEVTRLSAELATVSGANVANASEVEAHATQIASDLSTAQQTIGTLQTRITALEGSVTTITGERDALAARLANPAAEVQQLAAAQALTIVSGQGIPPIEAKPTAANPAAEAPVALKGRERTIAFWNQPTNPS